VISRSAESVLRNVNLMTI